MLRRRLLLLIVAVALVLRLHALETYVEQRPRGALGAIPFLFEPGNIAFSIASGRGFGSPFRVDTGPTAWMAPVYPEILAGIFHVFGTYTFDAFLSAALLNVAFSVLTCVPLFFAAKRIGGLALAGLAAGLWAVFPNAIILPYESLWDQSLGALLAAALLWATIARRPWWEQGLLWGVALMTTPTLGAALPFFLVGQAILPAAGISAGAPVRRRNALLIAAVAILACLPWTVRNYMAFHTLVPLRTVMGLSLWLGNNPQADGIGTGNLHPISNSTERALYIEEGEVAYNSEKEREALAYIRANPGHTAVLIARRFTAIWTGGSLHPIRDFLRSKDLWFRWVLAFNILAAAGALAGMILLFRRHNPYAFPAAVFPVFFPLAYYVTLPPPRYRHPIDPVVLLLAAAALQAIWQTGSKYIGFARPK